ncbi:MAG TPA: hypothetical protein VJ901_02035 [Thermoanaerobaculia bacterium]|nr:hypothetical protein [Thermoanaerobaculia bacterium]
MHDQRRITLVNRNPAITSRDWDCSPDASTRVIFVRAVAMLEYALKNAVTELDRDVERVVIDRSASAGDCLELLARLPQEFQGDVLIVRGDGTGYLSATARGDGRVLYPLSMDDIEFYLLTHELVADEPVRLTA